MDALTATELKNRIGETLNDLEFRYAIQDDQSLVLVVRIGPRRSLYEDASRARWLWPTAHWAR